MPFCTSAFRVVFSVLVMSSIVAAAGAAQSPTPRVRRFSITGGITSIQVGNRNEWGYGPELGFRRDFGTWGVRLNIALPAFGYDAGGAAIDLGPSAVRMRGRSELGASAGLSALLVGDNAELVGGGIGVFAEGHATLLLSRVIGLTVGPTVRAAASGIYPGASAGVALRL